MKPGEHFNPFSNATASDVYVAYIDFLGFSAKVLSSFEAATQAYAEIMQLLWWHPKLSTGVSLKVYSDSIVLTSQDLPKLAGVASVLHMVTGYSNVLVRGGVAFGRHIEAHNDGNLYLVSEALTKAVQVEKSVGHPCVAFHDSVRIPPEFWLLPALLRSALYFDGHTIVNPFNIFWGSTASQRLAYLADLYPEHRDKFEWLLELYSKLRSGDPLSPPIILPTR